MDLLVKSELTNELKQSFEEQRLKGNECVELPVLFFIDSDFLNDPKMKDIDSITLSYTFFKTTDLIS